MSRPKLVTEPEWLRQVAPNSRLNVRDIADIFGFNPKSLWELVKEHNFPEPDVVQSGAAKGINQWKVSTIRAELLRRKNLHNQVGEIT